MLAEPTSVRRCLIDRWPQSPQLSNCGLFDQSATVEPTNVRNHLIYSETAEPLDVRGRLIKQDRRHLIYSETAEPHDVRGCLIEQDHRHLIYSETADIVRTQNPSM